MSRKRHVPKVAASEHLFQKGLAAKDGLREVRFNVKRGGRKLVEAVEAATQRGDGPALGPLGLLSAPLNLAMRTTASFLSRVDQAAVDVLSLHGPYRAMLLPLVSSGSYFDASGALTQPHEFTADHHWRYRHWLALRQIGDVFVHEQTIALAGMQASDALAASASTALRSDGLEADPPTQASVQVLQALMRASPLTQPAVLAETEPDQLTQLAELGAVVVVLAGELSPHLHECHGRDRYLLALRLADEIATANRPRWTAALHCLTPAEALLRWIRFALRYM